MQYALWQQNKTAAAAASTTTTTTFHLRLTSQIFISYFQLGWVPQVSQQDSLSVSK